MKLQMGILCGGLLVVAAFGGDSGFGLGFVMGIPSGISAKIETGKLNSINLQLGYGSDWNNHGWGGMTLGGDYVWYNYKLIPVESGKLPLYFGPGARAWVNDNPGLGVRAVVGLDYQFARAPFDAFVEFAPGIEFVPDTNPDFSMGLGARYLF